MTVYCFADKACRVEGSPFWGLFRTRVLSYNQLDGCPCPLLFSADRISGAAMIKISARMAV